MNKKKSNSELENNSIVKQINKSIINLNGGIIFTLKDGSKWIEFDGFSQSPKVYNYLIYHDNIMDISLPDLRSLDTKVWFEMQLKIGVKELYFCKSGRTTLI